jgi:serine phosphatase RsbU (regulator of sigma subunit)
MSRLMYVFQPGQLPEPEEVVNWMHGELTAQFIELNVFATLCYMRFDMDTRSVLAVDAGHTKTIHFQRRFNRFQMLEGENMPLGCNEHEVYRQFSAPFEEGDLFVFYSDGVTEAKNPTGEFFGVERVLDFVREHLTLSPESLVERLREAVIAYSGSAKFADDLTCVVVRIASEKE